MWISAHAMCHWVQHPITTTQPVCTSCNTQHINDVSVRPTLSRWNLNCCFSYTHIQTNNRAPIRIYFPRLSTRFVYINFFLRDVLFTVASISIHELSYFSASGLDNRKPAWRGDTTPQDVIEAIIMLSRRDVQELFRWQKHLLTTGVKQCRRVVMQVWKARFDMSESIRISLSFYWNVAKRPPFTQLKIYC